MRGIRNDFIATHRGRSLPRVALAGLLAAAAMLAIVPGASAKRVHWMAGFDAPGTPKRLDRVGVLRFGPHKAPNVLVLSSGQASGSGNLAPLARQVVKRTRGWQVWSVERRENLLEDQSVLNRAKRGEATVQEVFDYYLRWLTEPSVTEHVQPVADSEVQFAKKWGIGVAVHDLRHVVRAAKRHDRHVVLGGHSLGGWMTTAYATWDFNGKPGVRGLSGLVFIDGLSPGPFTIEESHPGLLTADEAREWLNDLDRADSPWLAYADFPAPLAGLFGIVGASATNIAPDEPAPGQDWAGLPSDLRPPVPVTNEALSGYVFDVKTSPERLLGTHVHAGHLERGDCDPCGWVRGDAITPIQRYARTYSGWGSTNVDGISWYPPTRMTIDSGAIGTGKPNPAQKVLHVKATHGDDIHVPIYGFGAEVAAAEVIHGARALARQSHLPRRKLTIVDRRRTYAHGDPLAAAPKNAFVKHLRPFLRQIGR